MFSITFINKAQWYKGLINNAAKIRHCLNAIHNLFKFKLDLFKIKHVFSQIKLDSLKLNLTFLNYTRLRLFKN